MGGGTAPHVRTTVHYSGRVQGVGFRWRTLECLAAVEVAGFVQNLPDGRVLLVIEGATEAAREARRRVEEALDHYIRDINVENSPATGEFRTFEIRR
jgi:acylphosphatase